MKSIILKILLIVFLIIIVLLGYIYFFNEKSVAVLTYHSVCKPQERFENSNLIMDEEKFENQLKILKKMNYKTLSMDEYNDWKNIRKKKQHRSVLITFDDGWKNNVNAFRLLKKYNMKATVFFVGSAYKNNDMFYSTDDIKKVQKEYPNITFASHSYNMHSRETKTYDVVIDDIKEMKKIMKTFYYAYPYGNYNEEYINALKDSGYKLAFTFGPGKEHRKSRLSDDNYKLPRLNITNDMPNIKFILRLILPM